MRALRKDFSAIWNLARAWQSRFSWDASCWIVPARMSVHRRSPKFATLMQDLFAARNRIRLKNRLMQISRDAVGVAMSFGSASSCRREPE